MPDEQRQLVAERESPVAGWLSALMARGTAMPAVLSLIVIAVFFQTQSHYFLSSGNLSNLLVETTILVPIALAEVGVLLLAEIDLSRSEERRVGKDCRS